MAQVSEFKAGDVLLKRGRVCLVVYVGEKGKGVLFIGSTLTGRDFYLNPSPLGDGFIKIGHIDGEFLAKSLKEVFKNEV